MLANQFVHLSDKILFIVAVLASLVTLRAPRLTKHLTSPTLRHVPLPLDVFNRLSTPRRA